MASRLVRTPYVLIVGDAMSKGLQRVGFRLRQGFAGQGSPPYPWRGRQRHLGGSKRAQGPDRIVARSLHRDRRMAAGRY